MPIYLGKILVLVQGQYFTNPDFGVDFAIVQCSTVCYLLKKNFTIHKIQVSDDGLYSHITFVSRLYWKRGSFFNKP
jgi:hypothetical protein